MFEENLNYLVLGIPEAIEELGNKCKVVFAGLLLEPSWEIRWGRRKGTPVTSPLSVSLFLQEPLKPCYLSY
jgi:hypothetical protein